MKSTTDSIVTLKSSSIYRELSVIPVLQSLFEPSGVVKDVVVVGASVVVVPVVTVVTVVVVGVVVTFAAVALVVVVEVEEEAIDVNLDVLDLMVLVDEL